MVVHKDNSCVCSTMPAGEGSALQITLDTHCCSRTRLLLLSEQLLPRSMQLLGRGALHLLYLCILLLRHELHLQLIVLLSGLQLVDDLAPCTIRTAERHFFGGEWSTRGTSHAVRPGRVMLPMQPKISRHPCTHLCQLCYLLAHAQLRGRKDGRACQGMHAGRLSQCGSTGLWLPASPASRHCWWQPCLQLHFQILRLLFHGWERAWDCVERPLLMC